MNQSIDKAFISFRIGVPQWLPEDRFGHLLEMMARHRGVTDELAFFTSDTHAPPSLDTLRERVQVLAQRMSEARQSNYRAGINILATIGHHNENLANSLNADFTRMTAPDGQVCLGSFCPNDDSFRRDYVGPLYAMMADAEPDFIWIDDDVRLMGHAPIPAGCFCDRCLALFADECGVQYSRAALWRALTREPLDAELETRLAWLDHNRRTLVRLFELIERTVHGIRPEMPLGFMTGDRFFEGYDFETLAGILSGPQGAEVMWRPGGGFYSDEMLDGLTDKSHDVGRQVARLPDSVVSIQSEIENFPYQRQKAAHTTALEAASHIAAGCTGAAFNVLSMFDEPLDEYEPLVARLERTRPFLDLLTRTLGRAAPTGVYTGWNRNSFAACAVEGDDWFGGGPTQAPAREMFQFGIPAAYNLTHAAVTLLAGDLPLAFSDAEIRRILSSGVYLDARALIRLNDMGYGAHTGFEVERFVDTDAIEQLTHHAINGAFAERLRDGRQSFLPCQPAAVLRPQGNSAQILSRLIDYTDWETAACCSGVFENELGGRVCVAGYYPWSFLKNLSKSAQVKSLLRWLSRDSLDAYAASFHKVNLWVRHPREGQLAVALINASLDRADNITLMLRTDAEEISVFDMQCVETRVRATGAASAPYRSFVLPAVPAWQMSLVTGACRTNPHTLEPTHTEGNTT